MDVPLENIAYADETGIDTYLYREYGYAPRGTAVQGFIKGWKYKCVGIVAAKLNKKIIAPLEYRGTMNSIFIWAVVWAAIAAGFTQGNCNCDG